jgi:hypothetical protein
MTDLLGFSLKRGGPANPPSIRRCWLLNYCRERLLRDRGGLGNARAVEPHQLHGFVLPNGVQKTLASNVIPERAAVNDRDSRPPVSGSFSLAKQPGG